VAFEVMMFSVFIWNGVAPSWEQALKCSLGGIIFAASLVLGTYSFTLHFYWKNIPAELDKKAYKSLIISGICVVISFLVAVDSFAGLAGDKFLLPNGINFSTGFTYPIGSGTPQLAFYALCILSGAVFVYFLCDHKHYKKYGKHGLVDSTFLVAFPSGILGARIAYVIGEWHNFSDRFAKGEWWSVFAIWEGGLTILGGAIAGIIIGVLWYMWKNKGKSIFWAMDIIVPTILIAQAIGRWGNFFNCEVHGGLVDEKVFAWLPQFIVNNAKYSSTGGWAPAGMIWAPLFFIEACVNIAGYFVLSYIFGKKLNKCLNPGDLAFGYIIWYGFTRIFMEPLRDSSFNMGENGYWSWLWSFAFVVVGSLLILGNHLIRAKFSKDKVAYKLESEKTNIISLSAIGGVAISLLITGIVLISSNKMELSIAYNGFNIGLIFLVSGFASLLFAIIPLINLKMNKVVSNEK
jgi:phosphatidylglycerol:prolipoprotein diacylglycerol transferase